MLRNLLRGMLLGLFYFNLRFAEESRPFEPPREKDTIRPPIATIFAIRLDCDSRKTKL